MLIQGNALHLPLRDESVQCVVTSPPYYGLRNYGVKGQLGLEKTYIEYVDAVVKIFQEVHRVLRPDGVVWLNLGDSYSAQPGQRKSTDKAGKKQQTKRGSTEVGSHAVPGLMPKNLIGIPWRVAFALQSDGWYLRSDIIWAKPNPMPESVTDRPTRSHEYLFLLTKSARYYYNAEEAREPANPAYAGRYDYAFNVGAKESNGAGRPSKDSNTPGIKQFTGMRNARSVWSIATESYSGAHFATFPQALVTPCILAGSRPGDAVLDPFTGSGTVGVVCRKAQRRFVGIDLSMDYLRQAQVRVENKDVDVKIEGLPLFAGGEG